MPSLQQPQRLTRWQDIAMNGRSTRVGAWSDCERWENFRSTFTSKCCSKFDEANGTPWRESDNSFRGIDTTNCYQTDTTSCSSSSTLSTWMTLLSQSNMAIIYQQIVAQNEHLSRNEFVFTVQFIHFDETEKQFHEIDSWACCGGGGQ